MLRVTARNDKRSTALYPTIFRGGVGACVPCVSPFQDQVSWGNNRTTNEKKKKRGKGEKKYTTRRSVSTSTFFFFFFFNTGTNLKRAAASLLLEAFKGKEKFVVTGKEMITTTTSYWINSIKENSTTHHPRDDLNQFAATVDKFLA